MKQRIITLLLAIMAFVPQLWAETKAGVEQKIRLANNYWQKNNSPESSAFWNWAAYHTGNMEVYKLLRDDSMLQYSIRWAEHNKWKGATEPDRRKWRYKNYGEGQDYVLFGDWQICFQTFIDLYNSPLAPADKEFMVKRAKEVMGYEAYSDASDYWWWADALYMVMPVMTKMYKLTGDKQYLTKMHDNWLYANSIMYDKKTGLYFRDGKYVFPKHTTAAGKKDFWARGDGWVVAAFAKILQDLPKDDANRKEYIKYYKKIVKGVAACQQAEGYWTRSMKDAEQAPGRETSGTALFAYGIQWGINNGILSKKYQKVVDKAWEYLATIALQPDGTVGYVQPIGEKAIPGQVVNQKSVTNFGTGAFLLAACEYARHLEKK